MKNYMIVESISKAPKIKSFLNDTNETWDVGASYGHFRDLDPKCLSIEVDNDFSPQYVLTSSKLHIINKLKNAVKNNDMIWIASDYDREGESIAQHLSTVLKLNKNNSKRIVFTEITKKAILESIKNPTEIDLNMFYAQQARRILDRLIGYLISPILWKQIQNSRKKNESLSAGRVQSVVLKLVIDREKEIEKFQSNSQYKTIANFEFKNQLVKTELNYCFKNKEESIKHLELCPEAEFTVSNINKNNTTRKPPLPFITSTLQQAASTKYRMSPKSTMISAQKLYENGYITYMRTDSLMISEDALEEIEKKIDTKFGKEYVNITRYNKKNSKNAQEAHEACRPCNFDIERIDDINIEHNEQKLYKLIWETTVASQMKPCKLEIRTTKISQNNSKHKYLFKNEKIKFKGFKILYDSNVSEDDEKSDSDNQSSEITLEKGDKLNYKNIISTEKFSKPPNSRCLIDSSLFLKQ